MADVESVKAGDTLRVPVKVIYQEGQRYPGGPLVCRVEMPSGREDSLSFTDVEAAEHIPAPKVFKRGDWVRHIGCTIGSDKSCPLGVGYVLAVKASDDYPDQIEAFFAGWTSNFSKEEGDAPGVIERYPADQLEHDEAPE